MITWNLSSELQILKWFLSFQSFGKILGYSLEATLWKHYCLDKSFAAPLVRKLSLYQIQTISHLQLENSCWIYQILVASKI